MPQDYYAGVPREMIDWFPTINLELCKPETCKQECILACPRKIFEQVNPNNVIVAHPYECTVGDISCSYQCPFDAISFPSRENLKQMLGKAREALKYRGES